MEPCLVLNVRFDSGDTLLKATDFPAECTRAGRGGREDVRSIPTGSGSLPMIDRIRQAALREATQAVAASPAGSKIVALLRCVNLPPRSSGTSDCSPRRVRLLGS